MVLVAQGLFAGSAVIVLVLGALHLAFRFRGRRLDPPDVLLPARRDSGWRMAPSGVMGRVHA